MLIKASSDLKSYFFKELMVKTTLIKLLLLRKEKPISLGIEDQDILKKHEHLDVYTDEFG
jgi:hypothetical protein